MASLARVAAFTDTYLPTVNGVTYTIRTWRERWRERGGRMDVVYPGADEYGPEAGEFPVPSLPFPFYDDFRLGAPAIPDGVRECEVIHAHTPFGVGLGGFELAREAGRPLVASYHTPTSEYAGYLVEGWLRDVVARVGDAYERWFLKRADRVVAPSETARDALCERGIGPVSIVPNGVDIDRFVPTDPGGFRARYDLPEGPLVGYTGRHGYEKRLADLLSAVPRGDVTLVFGGDGPARESLEAQAERLGVDARFLGFLDREELPDFYSALDVFAFPSPIERHRGWSRSKRSPAGRPSSPSKAARSSIRSRAAKRAITTRPGTSPNSSGRSGGRSPSANASGKNVFPDARGSASSARSTASKPSTTTCADPSHPPAYRTFGRLAAATLR